MSRGVPICFALKLVVSHGQSNPDCLWHNAVFVKAFYQFHANAKALPGCTTKLPKP